MNAERILIGLLLLAHAVGHLLGLLPVLGVRTEGWNARSWLLTDLLGPRLSAAVSAVLWLLGFAGFALVGAAVMGWLPLEPWAGSLAVIAAWVSMLTLALYWNAFPALFPNKVGALAVDLGVLWAVWFEHWPTPEMLAG